MSYKSNTMFRCKAGLILYLLRPSRTLKMAALFLYSNSVQLAELEYYRSSIRAFVGLCAWIAV